MNSVFPLPVGIICRMGWFWQHVATSCVPVEYSWSASARAARRTSRSLVVRLCRRSETCSSESTVKEGMTIGGLSAKRSNVRFFEQCRL